MAKKKVTKKTVKKTTKKVKKAVKKTVKKVTTKSRRRSKRAKISKPKKRTIAKKKRTIVKKKVAKKVRKKILVVALPERCFWIQYGPVVKDVFELQDALSNITNEQFKHHVNSMKNDFAVWVEEVLGDKECAKNIKKSKTIVAMIKAVENELKHY